jgi:hypothetical protein
LPAITLDNSGTVTASCPGLCRSVTVTRGIEWRELELDCVGLTFPLCTPFVRGSCNRSVNQTNIINVKDTKHLVPSHVWSFYNIDACSHLLFKQYSTNWTLQEYRRLGTLLMTGMHRENLSISACKQNKDQHFKNGLLMKLHTM